MGKCVFLVYRMLQLFLAYFVGLDTVVVSDSYDSMNSTKVAEQLRRVSKAVFAPEEVLQLQTKVVLTLQQHVS